MLENNLFWTVITIVSIIIEWSVLKLLADEMSELKRSKICSNISILILVIITTMMTIINLNPTIKLFVCMIIGYIFYIYNYEVRILKSLLVSLLYWMALIGFDALGASIIVVLNSIENMNELLKNNILRLELIIISKSLLLSLIPLIKGIELQAKIKKQDYMRICIPMLANITSILVIFGLILKDANSDSIENIIVLIVSVILLLSNISLISIVSRIIKDSNLRLENKVIREKIDIQYKYYLNLQESQLKIRKLYHDMNNHMICIQNIYGNNNVSNNYIENIKSQLKEWNSIFRTNNMILDIILNEKRSICEKNNIDLFVDIDFSECKFIDMSDVCSIFSNMLDNSIEACNKINDENIQKNIKIRGSVVNKFFVIKCENTKINNIIFKNNRILTNKKDSFLHGIGISSIKSSVEKYSGKVVIDSSENKFIMNIYIPLIENMVQLEFQKSQLGKCC